MRKDLALSLKESAQTAAENFSRSGRTYNMTNETFEVESITPLSENTATVIFLKNTGKKAAFFFYFLRTGGWRYFVPTDSHIIGMESFGKCKLDVEAWNYNLNFDDNGSDIFT